MTLYIGDVLTRRDRAHSERFSHESSGPELRALPLELFG